MRIPRALPAVLTSIALVLGLAPVAMADDPAARKQQVDAALSALKGSLEESSAAVAEAARQYQTVLVDLRAAQERLSSAQAKLDVAKAEDTRLAGELAEATADEEAASNDLADVQAAIETSQDRIGEMAAAAYRGGGMGASQLSMMFDSDTTADLVDRIQGVQTVLSSRQAAIDSLANSRAALASTTAHLVAVRQRTADLRAAAADNLKLQTQLEAEASAAEADVAQQERAQAAVLASAKAALAADQQEYAQLEAERKKLEAELAERARQQAMSQSFSGPLYRPVAGRITSPFGMRTHPVTGVYKLHDGTDFSAPCGTPIRAAASGRVLRAYYLFGYGNQTVIENGVIDGKSIATSYSHQSRIIVRAGQTVQRGQVIGYSGETGYATGCHLHFMVYVNGVVTNPMNWL